MLLRGDFAEGQLCECLKPLVFHLGPKLEDLSSDRINRIHHLLVLERGDEVFEDPDVAQHESICLRCDHLDLPRFLVLFKQLFIASLDKSADARISQHLTLAREVKSGDQVLPVLLHKLSHQEWVLLTSCEPGLGLITHGRFVEAAHSNTGRGQLIWAHRGQVWSHSGNREVAQGESVVVCYPQTVCIDVPVSQAIFVKELQKVQPLEVEVDVFLLGKDLLTAVPLLV